MPTVVNIVQINQAWQKAGAADVVRAAGEEALGMALSMGAGGKNGHAGERARMRQKRHQAAPAEKLRGKRDGRENCDWRGVEKAQMAVMT